MPVLRVCYVCPCRVGALLFALHARCASTSIVGAVLAIKKVLIHHTTLARHLNMYAVYAWACVPECVCLNVCA